MGLFLAVAGAISVAVGAPVATAAPAAAPDGWSTATTPTTLSWATPTRVATTATADLTAVACPTATLCMALAADGNSVSYDGHAWTRHLAAVPPATWALSCPSTTFCMALGSNGATRRWNGSGWHSAGSAPSSTEPGGRLSCVSPSFCLAASGSRWSSWNGTAWSAAAALPALGRLTSLSCATTTWCLAGFVASGSVVRSARFTGTAWTATAAIPGLAGHHTSAALLSCPSVTFCLALGQKSNVWARYDGSHWTGSGTAPPGRSYDAVTCTAATFCAAVADDGFQDFGGAEVDTTTFTGTTWSAFTVIDRTAMNFPTVTCAAASFCITLIDGWESKFFGGRWVPAVRVDPDADGPVVAVSCSSPTSCAEVGTDYGRVWNGFTWSRPVKLTRSSPCCGNFSSQLSDVSCLSPTFCIASLSGGEDIDSGGGYAQWNGSRWSVVDTTFSTAVSSLSCVTTTFCVSVGFNDEVDQSAFDGAIFDGTTWSTTIEFATEMTHISCATTTFCLGVGSEGGRPASIVYNGSTWSPVITFGDTTATITAVSCQAPTFCLATDSRGRIYTYNGRTWSAPTRVAGSALADVDCEQAPACLAVGTRAGAAQYLGHGAWRPPTPVEPIGGLTTVTCPTSTFCLTGDNRGYVTIGRLS